MSAPEQMHSFSAINLFLLNSTSLAGDRLIKLHNTLCAIFVRFSMSFFTVLEDLNKEEQISDPENETLSLKHPKLLSNDPLCALPLLASSRWIVDHIRGC